jgi:biotin carboxyl carrier protein
VKEGDQVEPKQRLVIVEAMKMENPVVAPFKAEVVKINCSEGQPVDADTLLIELNEIE